MSALFSHSVPFCVLPTPPRRRVLCTVSVNHPESLGHKKPDRPRLCLGRGRGRQRCWWRRRRRRRQRRIGDWEQSGRGGEGAQAGADLRRRRRRGVAVAITPVVTNTQRVSVCSDPHSLTHGTCRCNYGVKSHLGGRESYAALWQRNEMERAISGMIRTTRAHRVS